MSRVFLDGFGSQDHVYPVGAFFNDGDKDVKLNEDRYEVFVNGEFVGHKTLLNQNDSVKDIDDFLKNKGFHSFETNLEGDHYQIHANGEDQGNMKDTLEVYFQNR